MIADTIFAEMHRSRLLRVVHQRLSRPVAVWLPILSWSLAGAVGTVLLVEPVTAQTGIEMARGAVCDTQGANIVGAMWVLGVLGLPLYGVYRIVNGMRKMSTPNSQKKKEGREEVTASVWSFAAAVVLLSIERVFAFLGITLYDCISFSLV